MAAVAVACLLLAGCGSSGSSTRAAPARSGGSSVSRFGGSLTVFAAASLTESFDEDKTQLVADNPGLSITYSFAGSQQLVTQVRAGAPADVVATADGDSMAKLVSTGMVEPPRVFATNKLQIVVARGNPKSINGLADLAGGNLQVVLADPSVPAGKYARQALDKAHVTVKPVSLELDVKSVLRKVAAGDADAGIVYVTDVAAADSSVAGIEIPEDQNVVASYPAAVVRATKNHVAAQAFVDQLFGGRGQAALRRHGFLAP